MVNRNLQWLGFLGWRSGYISVVPEMKSPVTLSDLVMSEVSDFCATLEIPGGPQDAQAIQSELTFRLRAALSHHEREHAMIVEDLNACRQAFKISEGDAKFARKLAQQAKEDQQEIAQVLGCDAEQEAIIKAIAELVEAAR